MWFTRLFKLHHCQMSIHHNHYGRKPHKGVNALKSQSAQRFESCSRVCKGKNKMASYLAVHWPFDIWHECQGFRDLPRRLRDEMRSRYSAGLLTFFCRNVNNASDFFLFLNKNRVCTFLYFPIKSHEGLQFCLVRSSSLFVACCEKKIRLL